MRKRITRAVAKTATAAGAVISLGSVAQAGPYANLNDWTGKYNTQLPNNYTVTNSGVGDFGNSNAVGGIVEERITVEERPPATPPGSDYSFLSDTSLATGNIGFSNNLYITGNVNFSNPNNADPQFFFGFYRHEFIDGNTDSSQAARMGFTVGGQTANTLRFQANAVNGTGGTPNGTSVTVTADENGTAAPANATIPAGAYSFSVTYTAATGVMLLNVTNGTTNWFNQSTLNSNFPALAGSAFNRFGIMQFANPTGTLGGEDDTFNITFSNINYTGESLIAKYWDTNGADPAAIGATPSGSWASGAVNFNSDASGGAGGATTDTTDATDTVVFTSGSLNDGSGAYSVSVSGTQAAERVQVARGEVTFNGGSIATDLFNVSVGATAKVGSNLVGGPTGNLSKIGTGMLTLSGANTYTGTTTVAAGTLNPTGAGALPGYNSSGQVIVNSAARLQLNLGGSGEWTPAQVTTLLANANFNTNSSLALDTNNASGATTISSDISGVQSVTKLGNNELILGGNNTWSGGTVISGGTVTVTGTGIGTGNLNVSNTNLSEPSAVVLNLSSTAPTTVANLTGAIGQFGFSTATINLGGQMFTANHNNTGTFAGVIAGAGGFTKNGFATLTLTGVNTYTGGTIINNGAITLGITPGAPAGTTGTLGDSTNPLTLNNLNTGPASSVTDSFLTLPNTAGTTTVGSLSGTIATPSSGTNNITVTAANAARVFQVNQTTAGSFPGVITGAGSFKLGPLSTAALTLTGTNTYAGGTTVDAGTLIAGSGNAFGTGGLTVNNGAAASIQPGLPKALFVGSLTTNGSGKLDLTNNDLVIKTSTLAAVTAQIVAGYNNGTWDGSGIYSSAAATDPNADTAIGFFDNAEVQLTSFSGVTLTGPEIVVKYTYYGDADLTGVVDTDDFQLFLAGYQDNTLPRTWFYGDFDYTGVIDTDDFQVFLYGYQNQGGPLSALSQAVAEASGISAADRAFMEAAIAAVPEPASLGVVGIAAAGLLGRRRRRA